MVWNTWLDVSWGGNYTTGNNWLTVSQIAKNLQNAWMTSIPTDPNGSNDNYWLGTWLSTTFGTDSTKLGQYTYLVWKRNWVTNAWFALMAKTEVEWSSNWVTCQNGSTLNSWYIKSQDDLAKITLCSTITQWSACKSNDRDCTYIETAELRYLLLY